MRDLRMKIAAVALALGLGGLGGYAIGSNRAPQGAAAAPAEGTKVVRRTIHAKPRRDKAAGPPHSTSRHALASQPVSTGSSGSSSSGSSGTPVQTGSSGASHGGSSHPPVSTGSSGGGTTGGGGEGEGESEHEGGD